MINESHHQQVKKKKEKLTEFRSSFILWDVGISSISTNQDKRTPQINLVSCKMATVSNYTGCAICLGY